MRSDALGLFWYDEPKVKEAKAPPPKRTPPERTWERPDYLPGLHEALAFNVPLFTDQELADVALQSKLTGIPHDFVWDIECYPNYFLIAFKSRKRGKVVYFEMDDDFHDRAMDYRKLRWVIETFCHMGFNSINYDAAIAALALAGCTCAQLWEATKLIIVEEMRPQDVLRSFKVKKLVFNHVDLIEVAPLRASLKIYGGRLHSRRMQDLPFPPGTRLSPAQIAIVRYYCVNDLEVTDDLAGSLTEQLLLRSRLSMEYRIDLRSKSDAQIAEAIIGHEVEQLNGVRPQRPEIAIGTVYRYNVPSFLRYTTPLMNTVLRIVANALFIVDETGSVGMPVELKNLQIPIANSVYRMGIGGLHSSEQSTVHVTDADHILVDRDVVSYYPRIILNQGLYPQHLGTNFLRVYDMLVERRIAAKKAGDKVVADSLKITINGSFGKLGSKYSILYAPDLLIQTTVTGQLSLLMLIERLELCGISVVSANTDGVVIKCPRSKEAVLNYVVQQWERDTNFETEETRYAALYSRDVNNYVAVKYKYDNERKVWTDTIDGAKTKGAYAKPGLQKNPSNWICVKAVVDLLTKRVPVYDTIRKCEDISAFVSVRSVQGGAVKDGVFLGKSIRWYYATGVEGEIVYAKSGNKVPRTDGAKPIMDLPNELPKDIDYDWYIAEAEKMLTELGYGV